MKKYEVTVSANISVTYEINAVNGDNARDKATSEFCGSAHSIANSYSGDNATVNKIRVTNLRKIEEKRPLILLCGKSGSGKTTIANILTEKYGLKQLESYTTRPPRYEGEKGHIFSVWPDYKEYIDICQQVIVEKEIHGHKYWATKKQLDEADIYVIDPDTMRELVDRYYAERPIITVWTDAAENIRVSRMGLRGDNLTTINERIKGEASWERPTGMYDKTYVQMDIPTDELSAEEAATCIYSHYSSAKEANAGWAI